MSTPEHDRLEAARTGAAPWKAWGPYLSERQWGTVREDYSRGGDAWSYFPHDHARSRAYRWGEDGIAGVSDDEQRLCLALALWNGADPILKERMFGLTNAEGNHGEDVKEYWFYVDSTPTHSYMKCVYKYPQAAYPYDDLLRTNGARGFGDLEYELLDTGVFDDDRYFDVEVEYAKADHDDLLMRVTAHNRGPEAATLHLLPTLWFRNTWHDGSARPSIAADGDGALAVARRARRVALRGDGRAAVLRQRDERAADLRHADGAPYPKDGINDHVIAGADTVNPDADRDQGRRAPRARDPGRRLGGGPGAAARGRRRGRLRRGVRRRGSPRRTPSTPASSPATSTRTRRTSCASRSPGCCGASSTTSTTSTAGCASRASTRGARTRRAAGCATSRGSTSSPAT